MAHFSGDAGLARIFACEGADPFRLLAAQWLGVAEAEVGRGGGGTRGPERRAVASRVHAANQGPESVLARCVFCSLCLPGTRLLCRLPASPLSHSLLQ
jgi:hypothetical protein